MENSIMEEMSGQLSDFGQTNIKKVGRLAIEAMKKNGQYDAMIKSVLKDKPLSLSKSDIESFKNVDKLILYLNDKHNTKLPSPLEYVKSSPWVLSYLDNYQHKKKLEKHLRS